MRKGKGANLSWSGRAFDRWLAIGVEVELALEGHRSSNAIGALHVEALEHILDLLRLVEQGAIPELLDLEPKKELEFTHH